MPDEHRFVRRKVEDEEFWLDLEAGRFYGLNETASAILDLWSKGVRRPADIAARIADRFDVSEPEALVAVERLLADARSRGLLAE